MRIKSPILFVKKLLNYNGWMRLMATREFHLIDVLFSIIGLSHPRTRHRLLLYNLKKDERVIRAQV